MKKSMKQIFCLALALCLCLCLAACGETQTSAPASGSGETVTAASGTGETSVPASGTEETAAATQEPTETVTAASDTEETAASNTEETTASDTEETTASDTEETTASDTEETAASDTEETAASDTEETAASDTEETAAPAENAEEAAEQEADEYLASLQGTYTELFQMMDQEECKTIWYQDFKDVLGVEDEETAEMLRQMIISMFTADAYGEDAIALAAQDPNYGSFDCHFIDGVSTLKFEGSTISGYDAAGNELFCHAYTKVEDVKTDFGAMNEVYGQMLTEETWPTMAVYVSDGEEDDFKYFAFCADSPDTTYHIEFRYGPTMDQLTSYYDGDYAYWLAAGFLQDAPEGMTEDVINLFVTENAESFAAFVGQTAAADPSALFASGTGTAEDPYVIENLDQMAAFGASVNDGSCDGYAGKYIVLDCDLDLTGIDWEPVGNMSDMETYSTMFMGSFDGQGHTVTGLNYESDEDMVGVGFFGLNLGYICNLTFEDCSVSVTGPDAGSQAFGIAVGYNMYGSMDHVTVRNSSVMGLNCVGGVVGGNSGGTITNCHAENVTVTMIGDNDFPDRLAQCDINEVGGLIVGGCFGGTLSDCTATGTVVSTGKEPMGMGGIGGCLEMMNYVGNCTADVTIVSENGGHAIGGLCGYAGTHSDAERVMNESGVEVTAYPSVIENCEVTVEMHVEGATHVGGLIGTGLYYLGEETIFSVSSCTVKGSIEGAVTPGAICGRAEGCTIENCTADITADGETLTDEVGTTTCMYESLDQ